MSIGADKIKDAVEKAKNLAEVLQYIGLQDTPIGREMVTSLASTYNITFDKFNTKTEPQKPVGTKSEEPIQEPEIIEEPEILDTVEEPFIAPEPKLTPEPISEPEEEEETPLGAMHKMKSSGSNKKRNKKKRKKEKKKEEDKESKSSPPKLSWRFGNKR